MCGPRLGVSTPRPAPYLSRYPIDTFVHLVAQGVPSGFARRSRRGLPLPNPFRAPLLSTFQPGYLILNGYDLVS
jgi:hypothetical protein